MIIDVPGNLLLFGEYAITKPGGHGIAFAIEPRVRFEAKANPAGLIFKGSFEGKNYKWNVTDATPKDLLLLKTITDLIIEKFGRLPHFEITIDSSQFSDENGRKKGYGSSAAVTVGVVYLLLLELLGHPPNLQNEVFPLALHCHRTFQGSRGSGYDIMTSLFGGAGIFIGGKLPVWNPISTEIFESIHLIKGEAPVITKESLKNFEQFCTESPQYAHNFIQLSTQYSEGFVKAKTHEERKTWIDRGAKLNRWIARHIGVPSQNECFKRFLTKYSGKALGSGGEIAAVYIDKDHGNLDEALIPVHLAKEGLRCSKL